MDTIKQLTELDYKALIIGISIVIGAFKIAYTSYSLIISKFGLETKKMRQKREDHELLIATAKNLELLQNKQNEDVRQSIVHDKRIKDDLKNVTDKVNEIAEILSKMQKADNVTEMKKLKEKLVVYYNKYKNFNTHHTKMLKTFLVAKSFFCHCPIYCFYKILDIGFAVVVVF